SAGRAESPGDRVCELPGKAGHGRATGPSRGGDHQRGGGAGEEPDRRTGEGRDAEGEAGRAADRPAALPSGCRRLGAGPRAGAYRQPAGEQVRNRPNHSAETAKQATGAPPKGSLQPSLQVAETNQPVSAI